MKQQKSRKGIRILKKRTRKGKNVVSYVKKKPKQATCARCGAILQGIPRAVPNKLGKMTRSKRRVSRKFGGVLCNTCVREVEKYTTRMEDGYAVKRDLTIEKYLPSGWFKSLKKVEKLEKAKEVKAKKIEEKKEKPKKAAKKKTTKKATKKKPAKKTTKKK